MAIKDTNSSGDPYAEDGESYTGFGYISGSDGADSFVVDNNSTLNGWLFTNAGGDTLRLDTGGQVTGAIQSTSTATQSDIYEILNDSSNLAAGLTPRQSVVGVYVESGSGNDSITVDGSGYTGSDTYAISIGNPAPGGTAIYAGAGNDEISITDSVLINGTIETQDGEDTLTVGPDVRIDGSITSSGSLGDTITVAEGSTVTDSIALGGGSDNVTLSGNIGTGQTTDRITSGVGEDSITITATANIDVAQIQMEDTSGEAQTIMIENGATVSLIPASYGAGILTGSGDDTVFLGGDFDNSNGNDVDAGPGSDNITLGSGFSSADNDGTTDAARQFNILGRDDADNSDTDTLDISAIMSRVDRHDIDTDPENGTIYLTDGSIIRYTDIEEVIMCFAGGTKIITVEGDRAVEDLRKGDLVLTKDNGPQPIRWIGSRELSGKELVASPKLRPIRILAGALGRNLPKTDLTVSPQHRVLVRSKIAQRMFSSDEVLVGAKHLLELDGVEIAEDVTAVEYFHILFDRHEVIFSNGAETESLHTGPQALKALGPAAREEIFALFPELRHQTEEATRHSARPLIPGRQGRQLAMRHRKNGRELVS